MSAVFPETKTELRIVTVWVSMRTLDAWMSFQTLKTDVFADDVPQSKIQKMRPVAVFLFQCQMCLEDGNGSRP